jgi:hypothetical protein
MSEIISDDMMKSLELYSLSVCGGYRICEDVLVYFWKNRFNAAWGAYAGLTSAPFTDVVTRWNGSVDSLCPTSGRFVYYASGGGESFFNKGIVVVDLF